MVFRKQPTNNDDTKTEQDYAPCGNQENFHLPLPLLLRRSRVRPYFAKHSMPCSAVSSSLAGIARNISLTRSGSRTVLCSLIRAPAGERVKPRHRASVLFLPRKIYPPRTNRPTVMLIADLPTPMCSASCDRVVGRVACR